MNDLTGFAGGRHEGIDSGLAALVEIADSVGEIAAGSAREAAALMGLGRCKPPWRSTINNDGSPMQLCVGMSQGPGYSLRLLVDPAADVEGAKDRVHAVSESVRRLLAAKAPGLATPCTDLLREMLPSCPEIRAALPTGGAWLAAALGSPGMALYVTARWGEPEGRWRRAAAWLGGLLPGTQWTATLDSLERHASLISAGVEGISRTKARAKLYWRLKEPSSLRDLDIDLAHNPILARFLRIAIGDRRVHRGTIVGSVSFDLSDGMLHDIKLDVCGHCLPRSWNEWLEILSRCCRELGLAPWPLLGDTWQTTSELAFIGFGLDRNGEIRLNAYLKSVTSSDVGVFH